MSKTIKLYYNDPYLASCKAVVDSVKEIEGKNWFSFDNTIFYPGGGGQLPDRGSIGGHSLIDSREEQEVIWYRTENDWSWKAGKEIFLEIDWSWRYYNMQQHSGQHLVSHVLDSFNLRTVSVHLGENYTLLEVEGGYPDNRTLEEIEHKANALIRQALPVSIHAVSRQEAEALPLRKPAGEWKELRVVEIEKRDFSACGGLHVKTTSEIGYIKITQVEKIRGNARIQAFIGNRADRLFNEMCIRENMIKQELQIEPDKFVSRIQNLKTELSETNNRLKQYRDEFINVMSAKNIKGNKQERCMYLRRDDLSPDDVMEISRKISKDYSKVVIGFCRERFYLFSPSTSVFDTSLFLKGNGAELGMRGGGPPGFSQGVMSEIKDEEICRKMNSFHKI